MDVKIIIPTAGRSDRVLTEIDNQILCVPEAEAAAYREHCNYEIITHPELKNLAAKRNWIYKKFGDVFMVDDDMVSFERVYRSTDQFLDPAQTYEVIQNLYYMAVDIGAKLFGFSETPSPKHYNPYKPLMLKGMAGGGAYGLLQDDKLYFTEKTTAADSHFITLLNMYYYRYSLIDTRFVFRTKNTFKGSGGQAAKRTMLTEKIDTLFLRQTFGEAVRLRSNNKTGAKKTHNFQRSIKTPW